MFHRPKAPRPHQEVLRFIKTPSREEHFWPNWINKERKFASFVIRRNGANQWPKGRTASGTITNPDTTHKTWCPSFHFERQTECGYRSWRREHASRTVLAACMQSPRFSCGRAARVDTLISAHSRFHHPSRLSRAATIPKSKKVGLSPFGGGGHAIRKRFASERSGNLPYPHMRDLIPQFPPPPPPPLSAKWLTGVLLGPLCGHRKPGDVVYQTIHNFSSRLLAPRPRLRTSEGSERSSPSDAWVVAPATGLTDEEHQPFYGMGLGARVILPSIF